MIIQFFNGNQQTNIENYRETIKPINPVRDFFVSPAIVDWLREFECDHLFAKKSSSCSIEWPHIQLNIFLIDFRFGQLKINTAYRSANTAALTSQYYRVIEQKEICTISFSPLCLQSLRFALNTVLTFFHVNYVRRFWNRYKTNRAVE